MSRAFTHRISAEELANTITHGIGLALSIAGFIVLLVLAALRGGPRQIISCAIYGATLVCVYVASTLYHGIPSPRRKRALRIFDHCAVYLLIAGTYTPFLLVNLRGGWSWSLLGIVWGLAMAGIIFKLRFVEHFQFLSTTVYVLMGWLAVIAAKPLFVSVPAGGLLWLLAGGLLYTVGVVFYAWESIPYNHVIWHLFVLAASACHYVAVLCFVLLPAKA